MAIDDAALQAIISRADSDQEGAIALIDGALRDHEGDARLHFLRGSLLAGLQDYAGAEASMRTAVKCAPGFALARYQLGFLLLTCARPEEAQSIWEPLRLLPEDEPLRCFVEGLRFMIRDEFDPAIERLEAGMARNQVNPPLNHDIALLIQGMRDLRNPKDGDAVEPPSSAQLLLQQAALRSTRH